MMTTKVNFKRFKTFEDFVAIQKSLKRGSVHHVDGVGSQFIHRAIKQPSYNDIHFTVDCEEHIKIGDGITRIPINMEVSDDFVRQNPLAKKMGEIGESDRLDTWLDFDHNYIWAQSESQYKLDARINFTMYTLELIPLNMNVGNVVRVWINSRIGQVKYIDVEKQ